MSESYTSTSPRTSDRCSYSSYSDESSFGGSDSEYSTKFYEAVVDTTLAARERRRKSRSHRRGTKKSPLRRTSYINQLYDTICDLTDEILADWKQKVVQAAAQGYSNVNIFEYSKGEKYKELPVVLLMTGPRDEPDFFERNGIFSVIDEIKMEVASQRFRVSYKYIGKGINVINVDWKSGLFDSE